MIPGPRDLKLIDAMIARSRATGRGAMLTAEVCQPVLDYAIEELQCEVADVWSVDPRRDKLILVATSGRGGRRQDRIDVLESANCLTGLVVETKRWLRFNDILAPRDDGRVFRDQELLSALSKPTMLSVPVLNTANPHQVLCVLNFLPATDVANWLETKLNLVARLLAAAIEAGLRERAFRMSMRLGQQLTEREERVQRERGARRLTLDSTCEILAECCLDALDASRVAVYLNDYVRGRARRRGLASKPSTARPQRATDMEGHGEPPVPPRVEQVLRENRELLAPRISEDPHPETFFEDPSSGDYGATCILVPLQDLSGQCHGVIQCMRQGPGTIRSRFSYDDIAVLEAMSQSFTPRLEGLLESEQRRFSQQKLSHELRVPVAALSTLLSRMSQECREQGFRFRYPHFIESSIYVGLMKRLLVEVDISRFGPDEIPLRIHPTRIKSHVIIPALRFTLPLLRERRLHANQFHNDGFQKFPELDVDAALVTEIVFNLLDNAIKYFDRAPGEFRCSITGALMPERFEIRVTDNGPGIDATIRERVFDYGVRGAARSSNAFGEGFGLWISRRLAQRHGGDLLIESPGDGTTFLLWLPKSVAHRHDNPPR